jgi:hypothetical protein
VDTKRARKVQEAAPLRSKKFWIQDNHIIVQVQETQFRVNSGLLARHSSHFVKLFSGAPTETKVFVDGCEVYRAEGDSKAFEALLEVLYEGVT